MFAASFGIRDRILVEKISSRKKLKDQEKDRE